MSLRERDQIFTAGKISSDPEIKALMEQVNKFQRFGRILMVFGVLFLMFFWFEFPGLFGEIFGLAGFFAFVIYGLYKTNINKEAIIEIAEKIRNKINSEE